VKHNYLVKKCFSDGAEIRPQKTPIPQYMTWLS
jgi:hypothetical protein